MKENPTVEDLKREQKSKKEIIKKLQKRRFNDLFIIIMPLLILVFYFEDYIGNFFSNSKSFIYFFSISIGAIIALYLLVIKYLIHRVQKEIDVINSDLYKRMKLDSKK
jgi:hypothetical protein